MTMTQIKALAQGVANMMYDFNCAKQDAHDARTRQRQHDADARFRAAEAIEEAIVDASNAYRDAGLTVRRVCYHNDYGQAYAAIQLTDTETGRAVIYEADQIIGLSKDDTEMCATVRRARREMAEGALKAGKLTELGYYEA